MTPYESINNLDDIAIQSGNYTVLLLPCYNTDNQAIDLEAMTSFGCTLSLYGQDDIALQTIAGTIKAGTTNVMKIEITSAMTENMSNCLLLYRPFVVNGEQVNRWQGRIYIGSSTSWQ